SSIAGHVILSRPATPADYYPDVVNNAPTGSAAGLLLVHQLDVGGYGGEPFPGFLSAGTQSLTVIFTPSDGLNYTTTTGNGSLTVNPATPTVTDAGGVYNGSPYAPTAASVTGFQGAPLAALGDSTLSYLNYAGSTAGGTGTPTAPRDAGTYTLVA